MGVASRRKADELIASGRVSVAGKVITALGTQVEPNKGNISIDGVPMDRPSKRRSYFLFYKPKGVVTTVSDPEGRPTVADYFPKGVRLFPVGRLDYDAEGVLLLTDDGDFAHLLMHPKFEAKRTYLVKVKGKPTGEKLEKLRRGVKLEDGFARPLELKPDRATKLNSWYKMSVAEGRNHLIKRLWQRIDHPVQKLVRTEYAGFKLDQLRPGDLRPLTMEEVQRVKGTNESVRKHRRP